MPDAFPARHKLRGLEHRKPTARAAPGATSIWLHSVDRRKRMQWKAGLTGYRFMEATYQLDVWMCPDRILAGIARSAFMRQRRHRPGSNR